MGEKPRADSSGPHRVCPGLSGRRRTPSTHGCAHRLSPNHMHDKYLDPTCLTTMRHLCRGVSGIGKSMVAESGLLRLFAATSLVEVCRHLVACFTTRIQYCGAFGPGHTKMVGDWAWARDFQHMGSRSPERACCIPPHYCPRQQPAKGTNPKVKRDAHMYMRSPPIVSVAKRSVEKRSAAIYTFRT